MSYIHAAFVLPFHLSKLLHIDQYTWENNLSKILKYSGDMSGSMFYNTKNFVE